MKRHEQDKLLKETLADDGLSDLRRASLENTLASARRLRQRRQAIRTGAVALCPVLFLAAIMLNQSWPDRPPKTPVQTVAASNPTQPKTPEVKFITDQELFALFPGRSLALIGKHGRQQLVFLDGPENQTAQ